MTDVKTFKVEADVKGHGWVQIGHCRSIDLARDRLPPEVAEKIRKLPVRQYRIKDHTNVISTVDMGGYIIGER